jgi:3-hydroxyacyl-CoA dehydrogenase/enoyl-CoA hydratase/3-hydroxybutyryl-CoA epimerase
MNFEKISYELKNEYYYIGFGYNDSKKMTVLHKETLQELDDALNDVTANQKGKKGLILFSHKKGHFLAGMDVSVINSLSSEEEAANGCELGQAIFSKIEDLKIPSISLVDGICLGGGLELSLSCTKIAAADNSKTALGLPEVMLGVLPGFGGTYRLPKKVGLPNSLDMILTGKQIRAKKAYKMGLVDAIMPAERLLEQAPKILADKKSGPKKTFKDDLAGMATDNFIARKVIFQKARETVLKQTKGFYPAPLKILDHLETNYGKNRSTYLTREAQAFGELSQTVQSKNLTNVFFLQDNAKKFDKESDFIPVNKGAVLGAGTMGGGIAWLMAKNDQAPIMKDIAKEGLELGLKQSAEVFQKAVKRRRMSQDDFIRKQTSISPTLTYNGFKSANLVVEAVVENMNVKKKVFAEMEKEVSADCIITSNTSSLSVAEMATALEKPERFAGLHFFNPVNKMPLVEIIKHPNVSQSTINSLYKWCLDVKKTPIIVGDGPGFLVNRILAPYMNEAGYLLEEGVSIKDIDKAALNFGMPMGPCRLMDEVGIDVCDHVGEVMQEGLGARAEATDMAKKAVEKGLLGKKASKGFYLYDEKGKEAGVNQEMVKLIGKQNKSMDETQIQMRLILPMINEAANILQDGIVDDAKTVDLGMIFGTGFPPFRGGLLKYADSEGLDKIAESINVFAADVSSTRYALSPLLKDLVDKKQKFYDL